MSIEFLDEIIRSQKPGEPCGMASVCSSHPFVLKAAMKRAFQAGTPALVEPTSQTRQAQRVALDS